MPNADPPVEEPAKRMTGQQAADHIIEKAEQLRELSAVIGAYELRELFSQVIERARKFIAENGGEQPGSPA